MEYCLDCGMQLRGRTDKKFCNDYCRGHYNNQLNRNRYALLHQINTILRKNESILSRFITRGISRTTIPVLAAAGFNFNFFTHQVLEAQGELYNYCYQHGYYRMSREELLLKVAGIPEIRKDGS